MLLSSILSLLMLVEVETEQLLLQHTCDLRDVSFAFVSRNRDFNVVYCSVSVKQTH